MIETDDIDESIIALLREDGRRSNREVARRLELSEGTVRQRLKKLQDAGAIRIGVVADPLQLGFECVAYVRMAIAPKHYEETLTALAAIDEVTYVGATVGRYDGVILIVARDFDSLLTLVNEKVAPLRGIKTIDVRPVVKSLKHDFYQMAIRF
jgi:Lrp/AsnC family transcriptional regulator, regulator for asnA, asnC and gidA